jgi:glycosyltransferase involved in cell wall biosynthesis
MDEKTPIVSIIMPAYNENRNIDDSITSILLQTFRDFEFIVINDGSTDGTDEIIKKYMGWDDRIILIDHATNQGILKSLNDGLEASRGKYIARMDADDISAHVRLEKQVDFLDSHPDIGLLGSDAVYIDPVGNEIVRLKHPKDDLLIRWTIILCNTFFHPTVMMRSSVLKEHDLKYRQDSQFSEDYDLWLRMMEYTSAANLPIPLVYYRVNPESISSQKNLIQLEKHIEISKAYIEEHYPEFHINSEMFPLLVVAFSGRMNAADFHHRPFLASNYLALWHGFEKKHNNDTVVRKIKPRVVVSAAKIALYPLFKPGWFGTFINLFK